MPGAAASFFLQGILPECDVFTGNRIRRPGSGAVGGTGGANTRADLKKMRSAVNRLLWLFLLLSAPFCAAAEDLSTLVGRVQPAVVTVITYDIQRRVSGFGSGFFSDDKGHVITNHHVVAGAYDAEIRLHDGTVLPVESVVAENPDTDLVRLSIGQPVPEPVWLDLAADPPKIAEPIVVVSSPMGLEKTVTEGIVSAIRNAPGLGTFFQISAAISRGSSGGPVVNLDGEVVGVVTFMMVFGQNLNFAVSAAGISSLIEKPDPPSIAEWTHMESLQEPDRAEALCREGFQLSVSGEYAKALEFYRAATEKDPTSTRAWQGLGFCYSGLDQRERAVEAYRRAVRINPESAELRFHLGNVLSKLVRYDEAATAYQNAVRLDPDLAEAHAGLAVVLTELGRYREAIESHREVIRLNPGSSLAYFNLGITLGRKEDLQSAADAYQKAVALDPDNRYAYQNLGIVFFRLARFKEAAEAHKQVIRIDPDHAPAHLLLGRAYLELGDKASALDQYKILKRVDSQLARTLFEEIYP